jgi:hypothetical protein
MAFFDKIRKKIPFLVDANTTGHSAGGSGGHTTSFLSPFTSSSKSSSAGAVSSSTSARKRYAHLIVDKDPEQIWEIISEIGDGAFGKVYKAKNKITGVLAAAKIVDKCGEDELDDYMIEIDILSECKHKNVVQIYEAYYYSSKLWVNKKRRKERFGVFVLRRFFTQPELFFVLLVAYRC